MRFLLITNPAGPNDPMPSPEAFGKLAQIGEELTKAGILIDTGGLQAEGTKVRGQGGEITVLDGPYTEAKELIAGYAIVEVDSFEAALDVSRQFYGIMGGGEGQVIQMFRQGDGVPGA